MKTINESPLKFRSWIRRTLAFLIAAGWSMCAFAGPAYISLAFRDSVLVNDTLFTVGDIAEITGSDTATITAVTDYMAGTCAPPGYGRFISIPDFFSCHLKNKFPNVHFSTAGSKRPLVRTDYRVVHICDHETDLRSWIDSTIGWKRGAWTMTIDNLTDSCKVLNAPVSISFHGMEDRFPKGRTNLTFIMHQGARTNRIPVRCHFSVTLPVVVALNPISRGEVIDADDCVIRRMDITRFAPRPYTSISALQNKRMARSIRAGTILHDRLLFAIPVVEKGDAVSIVIRNGRITITVVGIAREHGGIGDRIWVENKNTHQLIRVEIREKGIVSPLQGGVSI